MKASQRPQVVIIGAGFGGLFAAQQLSGKPVDVLLIDRQNYHTFTPLIYQVATSALDPSEIAYPIRTIFRKAGNVRCLMGEVTAIHPQGRQIEVTLAGQTRQVPFDDLIIAAGSVPTYFGNSKFQDHTYELRTLEDAVRLRNHILRLFEQAAWEEDPNRRAGLLTLVVVGGGPTGLETAGALYELYNHVLKREFAGQVRLQARVVLVEMLPHLLDPYPQSLQQAALKQLRSLGVEVILDNRVTQVTADGLTLADGRHIAAHTVVWTAGVAGAPAVEYLGEQLSSSKRLPVKATLEVSGHQGIYAVGDNAYLEDPRGEPYPMLIPVAKQQGVLAANNILHRHAGQEQQAFEYRDLGIMATIGRSRAVAWIFNRIPLSGYPAWIAWLLLHLVTLLGFRNRLNVLVNWVWNYFTYDRSVRIILNRDFRRYQDEDLTPAD